MFTAAQKIHKDRDAEPTEFEENVAQVINLNILLCCMCSLMAYS